MNMIIAVDNRLLAGHTVEINIRLSN